MKVVDGGKAYLHPELLAVRAKMAGVELLFVVDGVLMWDAEAADEVLPEEFHGVECPDGGKWLCFDPFGEVFHGHYREA